MTAPYLPPHVSQFVNEHGKPWPKVSVGGKPERDYTHVMCGDATAAAGFNHHFRGARSIDPTRIRQLSGHASNRDGLTARELAATLTKLVVPAYVRIVSPRRLRDVMAQPGVWINLLVDDDLFNGCDPSYLGDHWIGLAGGATKVTAAGEVRWAAWDPTCPRKADADGLPAGVNWEDAGNIVAAARKWANQHGYDGVVYVAVRQQREVPAPPAPPDPKDARIAELEARIADLEDEVDDLTTAVFAVADAIAPVTGGG